MVRCCPRSIRTVNKQLKKNGGDASSELGCIVFYFTGHGTEKALVGVDGIGYARSELEQRLDRVLLNRPKLILIDACQETDSSLPMLPPCTLSERGSNHVLSACAAQPGRFAYGRRHAERKGSGRNFDPINCSSTVSSNRWLDVDVV